MLNREKKNNFIIDTLKRFIIGTVNVVLIWSTCFMLFPSYDHIDSISRERNKQCKQFILYPFNVRLKIQNEINSMILFCLQNML